MSGALPREMIVRMSRFVMRGDVETASFDWGSEGMRVAPPGTGCETFVVNDFAEPASPLSGPAATRLPT